MLKTALVWYAGDSTTLFFTGLSFYLSNEYVRGGSYDKFLQREAGDRPLPPLVVSATQPFGLLGLFRPRMACGEREDG